MSFLENMATDENTPSVNVYIKRLLKEIEYWKFKAKKLRRNEHRGIAYLKGLNRRLFAENKTLKKELHNRGNIKQ